MNVFLEVFSDFPGVLDRTFLDDYMFIDKELLEPVCSFSAPCEEVIEEPSCDKKPTISKVLPLRQYLLNHRKIHPDDHDGIRQIKSFLGNTIIEKFELFVVRHDSMYEAHNFLIRWPIATGLGVARYTLYVLLHCCIPPLKILMLILVFTKKLLIY